MSLDSDVVVQALLRDRPRMIAAAVAVVRDVHAADDIFQQVVVSALKSQTPFRDPGHVLAWALRAVRHRALDAARRRQLRSLPDEVLDLFESRGADPAGACWSDQVEALHHCLRKLSMPSRTLLRLKYADGLPTAAVADRLGRTTAAVGQALCRVHRALRECVEKTFARPAGQPSLGGCPS